MFVDARHLDVLLSHDFEGFLPSLRQVISFEEVGHSED